MQATVKKKEPEDNLNIDCRQVSAFKRKMHSR